MNAEEYMDGIKTINEARASLEPDIKTLMVLIHQTKRYFTGMDQHYSYEELRAAVDENMEKGIRALEIIDELLMEAIQKEREKVSAKIWTPIEKGLPKEREDVLFLNRVGQVFEGFLEKYNVDKPYITEDNKIAFEPYPDGGAWYDYHFRSIHEMKSVVAWRYKPKCYLPETYDIERKRKKNEERT